MALLYINLYNLSIDFKNISLLNLFLNVFSFYISEFLFLLFLMSYARISRFIKLM